MTQTAEMKLVKYDSVVVANYLLAKAFEKGLVLNVTKVQKLLYILYGYFLAKYNHALLDEQPKAWPYGPVFPKTRKKADYEKIIPVTDTSFLDIQHDSILTKAIDEVINKYSNFTASQLSEWSHMPDSPWDKTTKQGQFQWNQAIPDEFIKEYFLRFNVI